MDEWLIVTFMKVWWILPISPLTAYILDRLLGKIKLSGWLTVILVPAVISTPVTFALSPFLVANPITATMGMIIFGFLAFFSMGMTDEYNRGLRVKR